MAERQPKNDLPNGAIVGESVEVCRPREAPLIAAAIEPQGSGATAMELLGGVVVDALRQGVAGGAARLLPSVSQIVEQRAQSDEDGTMSVGGEAAAGGEALGPHSSVSALAETTRPRSDSSSSSAPPSARVEDAPGIEVPSAQRRDSGTSSAEALDADTWGARREPDEEAQLSQNLSPTFATTAEDYYPEDEDDEHVRGLVGSLRQSVLGGAERLVQNIAHAAEKRRDAEEANTIGAAAPGPLGGLRLGVAERLRQSLARAADRTPLSDESAGEAVVMGAGTGEMQSQGRLAQVSQGLATWIRHGRGHDPGADPLL